MQVQEDSHESDISLDDYIAQLSEDPLREPIALELAALQSIYGDDCIKPWNGSHSGESNDTKSQTIRYKVTMSLPSPDDDITFSILVSIPPSYPSSSPPQLQLLSRYIGPFGVDSRLFGAVLRTFISSEGVEWVFDNVCVFEGIEWVKEYCASWFGDRKSEKKAGEILREDEKGFGHDIEEGQNKKVTKLDHTLDVPQVLPSTTIPAGLEIIEAEAITDRKSAFVGRACKITDPAQVPLILSYLMSDRRIARAAHPIINAWRCQVGSVLHQDNDDDGETAAGGRLAHLLQILEVNNVLVIVTRYFGGIHLGPDRFKHINQSARNALDLGGFLDTLDNGVAPSKRTGRKKR